MILDLGCGNDKQKGAIGIDSDPNCQADIKHDLNIFPYPFVDNKFNVVLCNNIVEHLPNLIRVLEELHRICVNGAIIKIRTPHCSSCAAWADMTHVRAFSTKAWNKIIHGYYSANFKYKVKSLKLVKTLPMHRKLTISNPRLFYILETYFIYLIGGFDGMHIELEVMK